MGLISNLVQKIVRGRKKIEVFKPTSIQGDQSTETTGKEVSKLFEDPLWGINCNIISHLLASEPTYGGVSLPKTNVCVAFQLIFHFLGNSRDTNKLKRVIEALDKEGTLTRLHQIPWDCQSMVHIVNAVIRCCTLYKEKRNLGNPSNETVQNISINSMTFFDHILVPLFKRTKSLQRVLDRIANMDSKETRKQELEKIDKEYEEKQQAYQRVFEVTNKALEGFTVILKDYTDMCPENLENPLRVFCSDVPRMLVKEEMVRGGFAAGLKTFVKQIPPAIEAFSKHGTELWRRTIQFLCSVNLPRASHLCQIWQLLKETSREEAFNFLENMLKATVAGIFSKKLKNGRILQVEPEIAEDVTGSLNNLFNQCIEIDTNRTDFWSSPDYRDFWQAYVEPEVVKIINNHSNQLEKECPEMLGSLKRIVNNIESKKVENAATNQVNGAEQSEALAKEKTVIVTGAKSIIKIGDEIMRDKYITGQGVTQGPHSRAHDMTFTQIWSNLGGSIDLNILAKELGNLRERLKKDATTSEHDAEIGALANAEISAKQGNGPGALEWLSKAGRWAFDTATQIGVRVAAEALKVALGL